MAKGGGNKKRFYYCTDPSGQEILYLRALQSHSGRNLIDPSLQDNILNPNNFFEYIYLVGCAINLHSIINLGLIPGGKIEQKTDGILSAVNPMDNEHKDPEKIDLETPRFVRYMHTAWKKHQKHGVFGRYQTCSKERIKVLSNAIERQHPSYTKKFTNHLDRLRRFP